MFSAHRPRRAGSLVASNGLALERNTRVAGRAQQLLEVCGPKYLDQLSFMRSDPVAGWQGADSPHATLAWNFFFHNEQKHACEQTLQEKQQVAYGAHGVS